MFENFCKIKIKGGCFESETELDLFGKQVVSIVYGRNGSGKTTIAHAIGELLKPEEEKNPEFVVASDAVIPEDKKTSVHIFDEDFVREQVRVENDGINTIIMLGEQVELEEKINIQREKLSKKEEELKRLEKERRKYDDENVNISPLYYFNKIKAELQIDGGWADIDRAVKGNTVKSRVTEDVVNTLIGLEEPSDNCRELRDRVETNLRLYQESENAQPIVWSKGELLLPNSLEALGAFLVKPIDAPELSAREQRLVSLLAESSKFTIEDTQQLLGNNLPFCPVCLREITEKDKHAIKQTITHILNKDANDYKACIQKELEVFSKIEITLPVFSGHLNKTELNTAQEAQQNLNQILDNVREQINERNKNIYNALCKPFSEKLSSEYTEALTAWNEALDGIERCVETFNKSVNKRKELLEQIKKENNQLARKQLAAIMLGYKEAVENSRKNKQALDEKNKECEAIQKEIRSLEAQKERTDIALDYINRELQYVFYSQRKIKLEAGDGCYNLRINGKYVKPKRISVGERNILGLCYFFAKLFGGKTESAKYSSEYLIVIDDPVSSFDYGNRVGVMSLLRFQFSNIIAGNANSRILVMSHDLHSIFDLVKIRNEVVKSQPDKRAFMELANRKLEPKKCDNEYQKLLELIFAYAKNTDASDPDDTQDFSIGNIMRRMLEAFSSFCYNISFEEMLRRKDVLQGIPENKREYYGNFMYRLTLNTESHMKEQVYTLDGIAQFFTKDEKIRTARSVLLFLLYINRPHIQAYLKNDKLAEIESWCVDDGQGASSPRD